MADKWLELYGHRSVLRYPQQFGEAAALMVYLCNTVSYSLGLKISQHLQSVQFKRKLKNTKKLHNRWTYYLLYRTPNIHKHSLLFVLTYTCNGIPRIYSTVQFYLLYLKSITVFIQLSMNFCKGTIEQYSTKSIHRQYSI